MGLTDRHALWFDGITNGFPVASTARCAAANPTPAQALSDGVTLHIGPPHTIRHSALPPNTFPSDADEHPQAWALFHTELAFEALHGPWRGNSDYRWTILRRTMSRQSPLQRRLARRLEQPGSPVCGYQ
jgi:hypothetical protein